ncbi:TPA: energy transducer TonB family protein [Escherichia coli]
MTQSRRPSPLQRRVLIVLAALDEKRPGPVLTRDIERVLEQSGEAPVYGPNLRASCRRLEDAGWLRTLRAPNLQLAVELTDAGRAVAQPLLPAGGTSATDLARYKRYPGDARKRARTGTAVVTFTVNTEGTIVSSFLEISSGTFSLDREAIAVLERAQPLPKPPPEILEGGLFKVKMPITFKLKE